MNAKAAYRSLFQRECGIHFRTLQRVEGSPVIFDLQYEMALFDGETHHDFGLSSFRKAILDYVGEVLFQAQVCRLQDGGSQLSGPRKFMQGGHYFVPVLGLE